MATAVFLLLMLINVVNRVSAQTPPKVPQLFLSNHQTVNPQQQPVETLPLSVQALVSNLPKSTQDKSCFSTLMNLLKFLMAREMTQDNLVAQPVPNVALTQPVAEEQYINRDVRAYNPLPRQTEYNNPIYPHYHPGYQTTVAQNYPVYPANTPTVATTVPMPYSPQLLNRPSNNFNYNPQPYYYSNPYATGQERIIPNVNFDISNFGRNGNPMNCMNPNGIQNQFSLNQYPVNPSNPVITLADACYDDNSVIVAYKPKLVNVLQNYDTFSKQITMKVLSPYHVSRLTN